MKIWKSHVATTSKRKPKSKSKELTLAQKWSFERLFHNNGKLTRVKTALRTLVASDAILPGERINLLLALQQLGKLDMKTNKTASLERYRIKKEGRE